MKSGFSVGCRRLYGFGDGCMGRFARGLEGGPHGPHGADGRQHQEQRQDVQRGAHLGFGSDAF